MARALGGPLAGAAVEALRRVLTGEGDEKSLAEAALAGDPEALARVREAEMGFRRAVLQAKLDAERIAAGDRADARAREAAVRDRTPALLACVVLAGFFGALCTMLLREMPDGSEPAFSIMLGALATMTAAVVNYYFGSSASSREKTALMAAGRRG